MRGRQSACGFTGHRPGKLPWGYDESAPGCLALKVCLRDALEAVYTVGYRHFLCGMAMGCDLYFCECALALRAVHPDVTVEAALPCPGQADRWPAGEQERYRRLVEQCDFETMVSERYYSGCMQRRNRYLVDHASLMMAVYDGTPGGTRSTLEYAMRRGVEILDLPVEARR